MSPASRVIAMVVAMTALSQFYRASQSVIALELMRELALSPDMLGLANVSQRASEVTDTPGTPAASREA